MSKEFIISVDFGGTKILTALVTKKREIVDRVKVPTDISQGTDHLIKTIADSILKVISENNISLTNIEAISLGVPGTVDPYTGIIGSAPNLGIKDFNIKVALQKYVDLPVLIENDVNLGALGILNYEFSGDVKNMLVLFVGTGIGGAMIFEGKLYRGSSFYAGEIGHILVDKGGKLSSKKSKKTFEKIASRTAIVNKIKRDIGKGEKSILSEIIEANGKIKSKALANAISVNDEITVKHISKACKVIGTLLGSLTTLLNVDTIVLGGGVVEALEEFMLPRISEAFKMAVLPEAGKVVSIISTKLGDDAALYGGLALVDEFKLENII